MASTTVVTKTDVAIIGGGMVGAALAALFACARKDWHITLIEAFPLPASSDATHATSAPVYQPSFDARSTAIASGSVHLLQQAGVWQTLHQHATPIRQVHVSDKGHIGGTVIDQADVGDAALGYVIPNAWIGNVLLNHIQQLPQVNCIAPAQVKKLQPKQLGATLTVEKLNVEKDDQTFELDCQLAVVADGAQSSLRKSLGIDVAAQDYQQTAIIANVAFDQPHQGVAYERFTDQGPMALLPLGEPDKGCESALVWTHPREQTDRILALSDDLFLQELQQRFGFRLGNFTKVGKRDSYPLHLLVAKEQVRSSIAVMGNAAHFLHPVAGQGFNLALRDCAALVAEVAVAHDQQQPLGHLDALLRYQQVQAADQLATIRGSDTLTKLFSTAQLPQAALRALGFMGLEALPVSKQWLTMQSMGQAGRRVSLNSAH
jgi:2-octaprenyl-6-methoxyphenol hydroxylase